MEGPDTENSIPSKDNQTDDNDVHLKLQKLSEQAVLHETEKQHMREEFGLQRAKMKELFLQKEDELKRGSSEHLRLTNELKKLQSELDEARSQVTVAKLDLEEERKKFTDEIKSLQHVITETILQSSQYEAELEELHRTNERLESEIIELREVSHKAPLLGAPGAMISTLTRKMVSQLGQSSNSNAPPVSTENLVDDSAKRPTKQSQDDEDVMQTLVAPLEEEIKALKEKLRSTDKLLRKYQTIDSAATDLQSRDPIEDTLSSSQIHPSSSPPKYSNNEQLLSESSDPIQLLKEIKRLQIELDDARSQVTVSRLDLDEERRKYNDEIKSFQHLITETVEESSRYSSELEDLQRTKDRLEVELLELRGGSHEPPLLAASGAMISTLARKMVSQLGQSDSTTAAPSHMSNDNLEESMRKAQEDAEVLRSLVIPLEEEINALKEKLRSTDLLLRKYQNEESLHGESVDTNGTVVESPCKDTGVVNIDMNKGSPRESGTSTSHNKIPNSPSKYSNDGKASDNSGEAKPKCNLCLNYETQLVNEQKKYTDLSKELSMSERCRQDLNKEIAILKGMEQKWNENKEEHKNQVAELQDKVQKAENALQTLHYDFKTITLNITRKLELLQNQREKLQKDLQSLELENDKLVGKHNARAQELQDAFINLPDSVEELQEMLLKCREDLITARVGQETAEAAAATQREEAQMYLTQSEVDQKSWSNMQNSMTTEISRLQNELQKEMRLRNECQKKVQMADNLESNLRSEMDDLKSQLVNSNYDKKRLEEQVIELRSRVTSLQTELDNGETVQKDFVLLSQSLQQELERIRGADTQVRWEHDEDVDECPGCRAAFSSVTRRKQHCRHCGRIFCTACLSHAVLSGPHQRSSKVCDVCHTLLNRNTAPYFSTEPPHSNE